MPAKAGRWELARFFTSLVSVTFFTKRERGDGGNSRLSIRTSSKNGEKIRPTKSYDYM